MNRYEVLERLGDGSFGEVSKARSLKTNEIVAIKKMKALYPTWEECLQLKELKSLRVLRHENVIQLKEVIRDKEELYFVFEYMQSSLHKVMRQLRSTIASSSSSEANEMPAGWLTEPQIKSIMYQLFSGLAYMHKHGFFHRDIKPENLLCHDETLKIADLGQAREIRSRPPFTDYVSTRWYRSPELLLRFTTYNSPIDLWACGCIMAELYLQAPIFSGSSEADQLCRISKILGSPTKESWPEGVSTLAQMQFKFPKCAPLPWKSVLPGYTTSAARSLISELLQYDPSKRLTATQALQHRFFDQQVPRPVNLTSTPSAATVSPLPVLMLQLPLKAETKATSGTGGWVTDCSAPTSSRWWRESSSTLPSAALHAEASFHLNSSRKSHESSYPQPQQGKALGVRQEDSRVDAKMSAVHLGGDARLASKASSSGGPSTQTWLSARKWTSPEIEDDDDRKDAKDDAEEADADDVEGKPHGRDNRSSTSRLHGDKLTRHRSSVRLSFRAQDNMLQDLLDEFLA